MIGQYYQPEDYTAVTLPEGDYLAKIIGASEEYAKSSGAQMAVLELVVNEAPQITFKYRIVEGEYFNKNMTRMFDCFKIPRGNFDIRTWVGKTGYVHIVKGKPNDEGKQYLEVKTLVVPVNSGRQGTEPIGQNKTPMQNRGAQPSYTRVQPTQTRRQEFAQDYAEQPSQYHEGGAFPEEIPF